MNVFIVDDSAELRRRLIDRLEELPEVRVVGHAEQSSLAIPAIEALRPEVAIVDLQLAGPGSGLLVVEVVKRLKPAPLVLVLTNYPYPQYRERCFAAGADYFFDKATEFDKVVDVCRELTTGRSTGRGSDVNLS